MTGRTWYTADLHLGHERIIELCDRPFESTEEMNEAILARINRTVGTRDTLVILGDTVLGKLDETLGLLNRIRAARIRLLPGNHDRFSLAFGHRGARETQRIKRRLWIDQYQDANSSLRCEPDQVPSAWPAQIRGRSVLLSHYPYVGDSRNGGAEGRESEDRYGWLRPVDTGLPLIHGHVHGRWRTLGRMFNVGVDVNDFTPVSEAELHAWLLTVPRVPRVPRLAQQWVSP
jgi:calcineurin-like phosphoesterase family protein